MKIILIARTIAYGGGAERLVFESYNALKNKIGESNIKLIVFQHSSIFNITGLDTYEKKLSTDENFHCLNASVNLSILKKNSVNISQLQEIINDFKPTIIHSHLYLAELISRQIHVPNVKWFSHFHDNMEQFENLNIKSIFSKKSLTNYYEKRHLFKKYKNNTFIAISKDTFNYANKRIKKHNLVLLPNAINLNQFYRFKQPEFDKIRIINIGSFVEKKNHKFILEIATELKNRKSEFEIVLLGDGPLISELKNLTIKEDLSKEVIFKGIVDDVNKHLNEANIYLHTAKYEPFGLVLLESMAVGLPVISLNGKGNVDLIENEVNGYVINNQNAIEFCDKIIEIYNSKELYSKISENSILKARMYDMNTYIENLIILYNT